jgi:hypothetical protein
MRRSWFAFVILVCFFATAAAWQAPASASQDESKKAEPKQEEKKKKKDKDKKKDDADEGVNTEVFSQAVANNVLADLKDGLEGKMQRRFLSAFDGDKMDGFLRFEDQIQAFFERHDGFRAHYRIAQSTVEGPRGVILVDFELEAVPSGGGMPARKSSQIRFELERGRKGWKIVDFRPREFFS